MCCDTAFLCNAQGSETAKEGGVSCVGQACAQQLRSTDLGGAWKAWNRNNDKHAAFFVLCFTIQSCEKCLLRRLQMNVKCQAYQQQTQCNTTHNSTLYITPVQALVETLRMAQQASDSQGQAHALAAMCSLFGGVAPGSPGLPEDGLASVKLGSHHLQLLRLLRRWGACDLHCHLNDLCIRVSKCVFRRPCVPYKTHAHSFIMIWRTETASMYHPQALFKLIL